MNIDWSKAPVDATHAISFEGVDHRFRKMVGGKWLGWVTESEKWYGVGGLLSEQYIERPKKQEAWNGEGLPPVGTVCDMHIDDFCWITGTVVVHIDLDEPTAVAHNGEEVFHGNASDFRPIKTAEQVAAEEREKAIADMMEVTSDGISCIGQDDALALYKAGYRKQ